MIGPKDLERRLLSLNNEEDQHVAQIEDNYANAKKIIENQLKLSIQF